MRRVIKLGPFHHPGGHLWDNSHATVPLDQPEGWYYYIETLDEVVRLFGTGSRVGGYATQKLCTNAYQQHCKRYKWRKIWQQAVNNMPEFMREVSYEQWVKCPKGTVPLPDFILLRASNDMKMVDGRIQRKVKITKQVKAAKIATLARLMGHEYPDKKTGKLKVDSMGFTNSRHSGAVPRDPELKQRLLDLAGLYGTELAKKLLKL